MEKGLCSEGWLSVTVSEPIASLLSSVPTPWVNEAGLTPSHPKAAPSQCSSPGSQGTRHCPHKEREGSSPGAWGPHFQAPSPHTTVHQEEKPAQSKEKNRSQPTLFFLHWIPHQMFCCFSQAHSCFLSCHILGLPDGQNVLLECRSFFYHSLHNHF